MNTLFSQEFLNTPSSNICDEITLNSFSKESILNNETIDRIISETELFKIKFNG